MMNRILFLFSFLVLSAQLAYGQGPAVSGKVFAQKTKRPVEFAVVRIDDYQLWAVADNKGSFTFAQVPDGKTTLTVLCLGYATRQIEIVVSDKMLPLEILLEEKDLVLDEVEITARRKTSDATTSYIIERTAIDHLQAVSVTDVAALLPGGRTSGTNTLTSARVFSLRSGLSSEQGINSFGTAVEIDGVRLSNNASFGDDPYYRLGGGSTLASGVDTRNLSSSNIESIEIITGVTSVEYGDLTNGMVKINTIKGRSPLTAEFVTKPNIKQYTLGKGFALGAQGGTLNVHAERTESVSDIASPYTTYDRNVLSLNYSNTLNKSHSPIRLEAGFSGNIGGYNQENDPDLYKDTYKKVRDNSIRANINLNWQINRPWITSLEASGSVNYADKLYTERKYNSSSSKTAAIHSTGEGYYYGQEYAAGGEIVLIPEGAWYQMAYNDSKQITYTAKAKATWARRFGLLNNRILVGAEYSSTGNEGRGTYYEDMSVAPTWREWRYSGLPYENNTAVYAEERATLTLGRTSLLLTAGLRSEWTSIDESAYGTVNSLSPRFNLKYDIPFGADATVRELTLRAGYGKAVKLPSYNILYPSPSHTDIGVFTPLYAYFTYPQTAVYNPDLKWQYDKLHEIGLDANIRGVKVSLSFFYNKTIDPYVSRSSYTPYSYRFTDPDTKLWGDVQIPAEDRVFSIDPQTGTVTMTDRTGTHPSMVIPYVDRKTYKGVSMRSNGSPLTRQGLEWIVDFGRLEALRTSFRFDGKYYRYKGIDETIYSSVPANLMADGVSPYQYIGYYVGTSNGVSNGSISKQLNANLTMTTHIPQARLIVSLRIESCLYRTRQSLSEYQGKPLAFVIDSKTSDRPSTTETDIYGGNRFLAIYPLYYSTHEDPDALLPFAETFEWARENDATLYTDLSKLINRTNYNYTLNRETISPYFSANIAVTKEIGRIASITFTATNFFNNTAKVHNSWTDTESSLYSGSYIPSFYYGLSLRLKL